MRMFSVHWIVLLFSARTWYDVIKPVKRVEKNDKSVIHEIPPTYLRIVMKFNPYHFTQLQWKQLFRKASYGQPADTKTPSRILLERLYDFSPLYLDRVDR